MVRTSSHFAASLFLRRDHAYRDPRASDRKLTDFQNRRARKEVGVQLTARLVGEEWDAATFMFHHDLDHSRARMLPSGYTRGY